MTKYINGKAIKAFGFGFDGCHKFYLIETPEQSEELCNLGYQLWTIDELPFLWTESCPLRFIDKADLSETVVPQCTPAIFEGDWDIDIRTMWELNAMRQEQEQANEMALEY